MAHGYNDEVHHFHMKLGGAPGSDASGPDWLPRYPDNHILFYVSYFIGTSIVFHYILFFRQQMKVKKILLLDI